MLKGIDVSCWQGNIDWSKVKSQIDFVILRAGYGKHAYQKDSKFEEYYANCEKYGINKGVYWFSYATTKADAILEAKACLEVIKGKKFEYPVWFDFEHESQWSQSIAREVIPAFISTVQNAGYHCGLYSFYAMLKGVVPKEFYTKYDIWLAHIVSNSSWAYNKQIWQYSFKGRINGIKGEVDLDYCFVDYPSLIKAAGKNGFSASDYTSPTKPLSINSNTTTNEVVKYAYNDKTQISKHFNVSEFKCKCGRNHDILINTLLVARLEKLRETFDCSKIIVNSGYRCSTHDKNVGGSGSGQHVNGNAADIVLYDKNNKPINTKLVSCAAQDIGFGGIGNIDKGYTAIHVDVRTNNIWKGDETVNNSTLTNDFYKYYGLTKEDVYKKNNATSAPSETKPVTPPTPPETKPVEPVTPPTPPETKPVEPVTPPTNPTPPSKEENVPVINKGLKITLNNTSIYASASSKNVSSTKSGTYYVYDGEVINNKIRITNSEANVGKAPAGTYVTGWIDASIITNVNNNKLTTGSKLSLNGVSLYATASASRCSAKKTGTFYVYDDDIVNERIRITNSTSNVGKAPAGTYVTGWINVSDIKK